MSQMLAKVTCPNCGQPFGAPLEQILDVEVDPSAKGRLLSGQVNLAVCPHCGMVGGLSLPFLYHDPAKELALVLTPMDAGRTELERQQVIGALSRAIMNQLPPEQRKSYLLNPQVFLSLESLIKRVLEADGITPEMIEAQRARADLLRRLLEAPSAEERLALVRENESSMDDEFFQILHVNLGQVEAVGQQDLLQQLLNLRSMLLEQTTTGRRLAARTEAVQELQEQPTREKLVDLLVAAEDEETRMALIALGQSLLDYFFFQAFTQRIEATEDERERTRLESLRKEVMDFREQLKEQVRQVVEAKKALLQSLLLTEEPKLLARRRLAEMNELFFGLLAAEIEQAQGSGDEEAVSRLQEIWQLTMGLVQETVPPEILLMTQIGEATDDAEVRRILEENRQLVGPALLEVLESVEGQLKEQGNSDVTNRVGAALAAARMMVQAQQEPTDQPRPSGLVTA